MKIYPLIFLCFVCCCESKTKPTVQKEAITVKDSIEIAPNAKQVIQETDKPLTYEQQLSYLTDTIQVTTKQNYYNRDYTLTINEFVEEKEKAIEIFHKRKHLSPDELKAYQIVLTLDGKPVFKKLIHTLTFRDSLKNIPLEKYYLAKVKYTGVRVNKLFFATHLRLKVPSAGTPPQELKDRYIMFEIDYLNKIGQLKYSIYK